jgi:peptidyl-tRNA hydrolase
MRMYILIRDHVPTGFALVAAAHASLAAYLRFRETDEVRQWLSGAFFKTICRVTDEQFESAKAACPEHVVITESALGGRETALAFRPREEYPKAFRFFPLYK